MNALDEKDQVTKGGALSPQVRMRMLQQMAEALEDEASGLYRRAAVFEEEEFLLNREIEERQTEINRLQLKLDSLRAERDGLMERIEQISTEATAMREEVFNNEEEIALAGIKATEPVGQELEAGPQHDPLLISDKDGGTSGPVFFHRMSLT